jgi:hypothetical protein
MERFAIRPGNHWEAFSKPPEQVLLSLFHAVWTQVEVSMLNSLYSSQLSDPGVRWGADGRLPCSVGEIVPVKLHSSTDAYSTHGDIMSSNKKSYYASPRLTRAVHEVGWREARLNTIGHASRGAGEAREPLL